MKHCLVAFVITFWLIAVMTTAKDTTVAQNTLLFFDIDWNPNSQEVAFTRPQQIEGLVIYNLQGSVVRHTSGTGALAWSPDGDDIILAGLNSSILDADTLVEENIIRDTSLTNLYNIEWNQTFPNQVIIVTGQLLQVWDVTTQSRVKSITAPNGIRDFTIALHPDGIHVALLDPGNPIVYVLNIDTEQVVTTFNHSANLIAMAWSPDGSLLATSTGNIINIWSWGSIVVAATPNNAAVPSGPIRTLVGHTGQVEDLSWSVSGLVSLGRRENIRFWDTTNWNNVYTLPFEGFVPHVEWSPDGEYIAYSDDQARVFIIPNPMPQTCPAAPNPDHIIAAGNITALRSALSQDTNGDGEVVIELTRDSTYTFTAPAVTSTDYGNAALPVINRRVTIYGRCATFQRPLNASTPFRFFRVENGGHLTLHDLTLTGGRVVGAANHPTHHYANGGAIHVRLGHLTLNRTTFIDNQANYRGGAVYAIGTNQAERALLTITDSTFNNNRAREGGAVSTQLTNTTITGSHFTNNNVIVPSTGLGSALHFSGVNNASATNSCFEGNFTPATSVWASIFQQNTFSFSNNWWGSPGGPQVVPGGPNQNTLPVPDSLRQGIPYFPPLSNPCGGGSVLASPPQ